MIYQCYYICNILEHKNLSFILLKLLIDITLYKNDNRLDLIDTSILKYTNIPEPYDIIIIIVKLFVFPTTAIYLIQK